MKTGQWSLSDSEVSQLLAQLEVTPQGAFDYGDWIAALVDWKSLQVAPTSQQPYFKYARAHFRLCLRLLLCVSIPDLFG